MTGRGGSHDEAVRTRSVPVRVARTSVLLHLGWRQARHHPGQVALSVLGIALAVAVVIGIDLASQAAHRGFALSNDQVMGRTTHVVTAGERGVPLTGLASVSAMVPPPLAAPVVDLLGTLAPVIPISSEGSAPAVPGATERRFTVLGVDPLAERRFARYGDDAVRSGANPGAEFAGLGLLSTVAGVQLTRAGAAQLGVAPGDGLWLRSDRAPERRHRLRLIGYLDADESRKPGEPSETLAAGRQARAGQTLGPADRLAVVDIALAQVLAGLGPRVDRLDLRLSGPAEEAKVRAALPPGTRLESAGARASARREMSRGFEINLRMLGLLSLVVGALLIYSVMNFSVSRRERTFASLRALGMYRAELWLTLLGEALIIGILGAAFGLLLGVALGHGLVGLVSRTLTDLYFADAVADLELRPLLAAQALALATSTSVLATLPAARRAMGVRTTMGPRETSVPRATSPGPPGSKVEPTILLAAAGVLAIASGYALTGAPLPDDWSGGLARGGLWAGYVALFLTLLGCAAVVPALIERLLAAVARGGLFRAWPVGSLALGGLRAGSRRTSVATIAFMIALATTVGVGVMIDSFRHSVERWLSGSLQATFYVSAKAPSGLSGALVERLAGLDDVASVSAGLWTQVHATFAGRAPDAAAEVRLWALDPGPGRLGHYQWIQRLDADALAELSREDLGNPAATSGEISGGISGGASGEISGESRAFQPGRTPKGRADRREVPVHAAPLAEAFTTGRGVLVSEPFASRHGLALGEMVALEGELGRVRRPVLGIFRDYRTEAGYVVIAKTLYDRYWPRLPDPRGEAQFTGAGINVIPGVDPRAVFARIEALLPAGAQVRTSAALRARSLEIFDRTFAVTDVLRWLTGAIAALAITSALLAVELDRRAERAYLRAIGMTRRQVMGIVELEGLLQGGLASVLAMPVGLVLAWFLVEIINRRAFGWSMGFEPRPGVFVTVLLIGLAAAALAGLVPAWRAARAYPGAAMRAE